MSEPPLTVRPGWNRALLAIHIAVLALHCWMLDANLREPGCFPRTAFSPGKTLLVLTILAWFGVGVRGIRIGPRLVCVPLVLIGAILWGGGLLVVLSLSFSQFAA